jgi:hypothetical protein
MEMYDDAEDTPMNEVDILAMTKLAKPAKKSIAATVTVSSPAVGLQHDIAVTVGVD